MGEVEVDIHVREREVVKEFLARQRMGILTWFSSEDIFLFPPFLDLQFDLVQMITLRKALVSALACHVRVVAEHGWVILVFVC